MKQKKVEMVDDITKVLISKQDITSGKELPGAKLQIIDEDNNIVHEWLTTNEPKLLEKLPVGNYVLREISAPNGYEIAEDVKFTVNETGEIQKVVMKDQLKPDYPDTGDNSNLHLYVMGAMMSFAVIVLLSKKKKDKQI